MDVIQDYVLHLWTSYLYHLDNADKRVSDWLLMGAFSPTILLTGLYLLIVWVGPKMMKSRPPFEFRWSLFIYNIGLVALNLHIFSEILIASSKAGYNYSCQPLVYSYDENELRIANAIWWFYISKLFEFIDTFFFIMRKKDSQVSFLHVYHHATMFPIWWTGVKWAAGGQAFFGPLINSFVHILMYTYYGVAALGPEYQKYLWWKKYLTRVQLVQFVAGVTHATQSLCVGCEFPLWMQYALILYGISIFALFVNFYRHTYRKSKKSVAKDKKSIGSVSNGVNLKLRNGAANDTKKSR